MSVERIQQQFRDSVALQMEALDALSMPTAAAVDAIFTALANGNRILACGNGASAFIAQRFAAALTGRFERERPSLPARALLPDAATFPAAFGAGEADQTFARQVRVSGQPGDVLLVVSPSGSDANVLAAVADAHQNEMMIVALTGNGGGPLGHALTGVDILIDVPAGRESRIHEIHLLIVHCLCDGIDAMLLGDEG